MKRACRFGRLQAMVLGGVLVAAVPAVAQSTIDRAGALERNGEVVEARAIALDYLHSGASNAAGALRAAELLDAAGSGNAAEAYGRVLEMAPGGAEAQAARRRLVLLELLADRPEQARKLLEAYRSAGGNDLSLWPPAKNPPQLFNGFVEIPGPLLGFQRMAAIRPETDPENLLAALARNEVTFGYEFSQRYMKVVATEYMKLMKAYLAQARELRALAGDDAMLRVGKCEEAAAVLKVIGYRINGSGCAAGANAVLEVDDANRAFLTNNSGFPVIALERAVQGKAAFELNLQPVKIPVLLGAEAWARPGATWIDQFLDDRNAARLYLGFSHLDTATAELLRRTPGTEKLKPSGAVLDFFGSTLRLDGTHAALPGGPGTAESWRQIVGTGPDRAATFIPALLERDEGWAAAFYDALWRTNAEQRRYLSEPGRMLRFYRAVRGKNPSPGPARPVFRATAQLMLLCTRLRLDAAGRPVLPGGVAAWRSIFRMRAPAKAKRDKRQPEPPAVSNEDEVIEALFSRVREADENGALNVFLALNEMDRVRTTPLGADTVLLLSAQYPRFSQYYSLFTSWPQLHDATIEKLLDVFESLSHIRDPLVRADSLASFQALLSIWDIFVRQAHIADAQVEPTVTQIVDLFAKVDTQVELVDAGRTAVRLLVTAGPEGASVQQRMVTMLAGPGQESPRGLRDDAVNRIRRALDAQRLLSLDTIFTLADQLERAGTQRPGPDFIRTAARLKELNLPNPFPSLAEKNAAFQGLWTERHLEAERDTDLAKVVQGGNVEKMARARGQLAPHLRDTLVGFVYAYYAPAGSALLNNNPLFVRSHDFLGMSGQGTGNEIWGPGRVSGLGWPWSAGGRFIGSLSGIAYALAEAEKDFLVPQNVQSLVWGELAPQMLVCASVPRWWHVSPRTQHWLALHLRLGRDLFAEAALSAEVRRQVLEGLPYVAPRRIESIRQNIEAGRVADAVALVTPAELYDLARGIAGSTEHSAMARRSSPAAAVIAAMAAQYPAEASPRAVSEAFGAPHPKLARSFRPELLSLPLFPALLGYSSRLLAESWESNNLYWAELADEMGLEPVDLNRMVPELTRKTLEKVFANNLEDWPALLAAMRSAGDEFRRTAVASAASGPSGISGEALR